MTILEEMGKKAKEAARTLAVMGEEKNDALKLIAKALIDNTDAILAANKIDVDNGRANDLTESIIDRLSLSKTRIEGMAQGVLDVAALPDPIGAVLSGSKRPNGLNITKVRVPIGVIGIIFEARPNVTSDAASLCLKSGNTVILRGGKVKTTAGFGPFCHGRGEDKFVEFAIVGMQNFVFGSFPPFFAFVNENDVLSDFQHGVHVVGVDDGGDVVLFGDLLDQVVDHN